VSDKAVAAGGGYIPEVLSAGDYYAFGMGMVDRRWSLSGYRYGFNGKENDNEVKGEGNEQDYGMRVYDPRVGRFLSVDPLTNQFPHYTPYQFSGNTPIQAVDLDGSEERHYLLLFNKSGKPYLKMTSEEKVKLHSLFGFTWTTPIHAERADVNYNGTHYYIGYAGVKGAGNQDKIGDFHDWAKSPDPSLLPKLFNDEANSHWAAGTNAANGLMLSMWTYGNFLPLNTAKVPSAKTDYANHGSEYIDDALRSEPIDYGYASSSKRADHAMRHLIDQGVLPGTPNSKIARNAWSSLVKNVMSSPATTFDYFLQGAQTTGYYKKIGGQDVVLFVAKEAMGTVKAGQVIGGWVPSQALNPDIMAIINAPYVQSHVQSHSQSQSH
jgi:RHS repeat-associated protein